MSQFALRLPDSLAESIRRLAEENRVSMNQYMMMTLAEKVGSVDTARFFAERRERAKPALAAKIWAKVPAAPPVPGDELPHGLRVKTNTASGRKSPRSPRKRTAKGTSRS
jgi:hypothetical protein